MATPNHVLWLNNFFVFGWKKVLTALVAALFGVALRRVFGNYAILGTLLSCCGGVLILMIQEIESQSIKEEVIVLARQLEDVINHKPVNQEQLGVASRLLNGKSERYNARWKSLGLFLLMLGITFSIM